MRKFLTILLILPVLAMGFESLTPVVPQAEAARLGGGRSFGSSPSFNRTAPAPQRNVQPTQPGQPKTGSMAQAAGPRTGGFLGPLLAGSALGALFFGGAFSGVGVADLLVIGLLVYFATRMLRRRVEAQRAAPATSGAAQSARSGQDMWNSLRSNDSAMPGATVNAGSGLDVPDNFNVNEFLEGAKLMYVRMQESWDKRDLQDISQFTTPGMYKIIVEQAKTDPDPAQTDILTLNATLYGFSRQGNTENVAVYFDALLREYADKGGENTREVWHFIRSENSNWKLDGIQQVANG